MIYSGLNCKTEDADRNDQLIPTAASIWVQYIQSKLLMCITPSKNQFHLLWDYTSAQQLQMKFSLFRSRY